ncbi:MAG: hypothetical protein FWB72_04690 [Firmicutes bacterium]|nr:hypothetical protein [Bacillota bacterium]
MFKNFIRFKKFSKLFLLKLCVAVVFLFTGCGTVTYTYIAFMDGRVAEIVDIEFDSGVVNSPRRLQEARAIVMLEAGQFAKQKGVDFTFATNPNNPHSISVLFIFESAKQFEEIRGVKFGSVSKSGGFFFNTHYLFKDVQNVFYQNRELIEYLNAKHACCHKNIYNFTLIQQIATSNTIIQSNASDIEFDRASGTILHKWFISAGEGGAITDTMRINMFITNPNTRNWYALALGLTLALKLVGLVIYRHKFREQ